MNDLYRSQRTPDHETGTEIAPGREFAVTQESQATGSPQPPRTRAEVKRHGEIPLLNPICPTVVPVRE